MVLSHISTSQKFIPNARILKFYRVLLAMCYHIFKFLEMATSRIFWSKINIFLNLCTKRFFMSLRSFSYQIMVVGDRLRRRNPKNIRKKRNNSHLFCDVFRMPPTQTITYDHRFVMKMIAKTWGIFWYINFCT